MLKNSIKTFRQNNYNSINNRIIVLKYYYSFLTIILRYFFFFFFYQYMHSDLVRIYFFNDYYLPTVQTHLL